MINTLHLQTDQEQYHLVNMAYYAKISNEEFTVSERARLNEAQSEKSAIEANNIASDEYAALKTTYDDSFTSATLQTLEGELDVLYYQHTEDMTEDEKVAHNASITEKQAEIDTEKAGLVPGQEAALASLNAKEAEGTEERGKTCVCYLTWACSAFSSPSCIGPLEDNPPYPPEPPQVGI